MIRFNTYIKKFGNKGEKSGWTYIEIPNEIAELVNPGVKKAYRVKGSLDSKTYNGISLTPMGGGDYIMALNASIRKLIKKKNGEELLVEMEVDTEEKNLSDDLLECLSYEEKALNFFNTLPRGHQKYFSDWIESAKTATTKSKRITMTLEGLSMHMGYPEMIRYFKEKNRKTEY